MYNRKRLDPEDRKRQIVLAAVAVVQERHLYGFNIKMVSQRLQDCSKSTIKHYFSIDELRQAVIDWAIANPKKGASIIEQARAAGCNV